MYNMIEQIQKELMNTYCNPFILQNYIENRLHKNFTKVKLTGYKYLYVAEDFAVYFLVHFNKQGKIKLIKTT